MRALSRSAVALLFGALLTPHLAIAQERELQDAIGLLGSSSFRNRERAADTIARFGERGLPALPALRGGLGDSHELVRAACARAIAAIGPGAAEAIGDLVPLLADERAGVRPAVLSAIAALRVADASVLAALDALVTSGPLETRRAALRTFGALGSAAAPRLVAQLAADEEALAEAAVSALQEAGRHASAALVEAGRDERAAVRARVVRALDRREHTASAVVATLRASSADEDLAVRVAATRSLGTFLGDANGIVEALTAVARDRDADLAWRRAAVEALGQSQRRRKELARELLPRLDEEDRDGWHEALLGACVALRCEEPRFADAVTATLQRRAVEPGALVAALRGVPLVARTPEGGARLVAPFLGHRDEAVRVAAALALAPFVESDPNGLLPILTKLGRDRTPTVRAAALVALAALQSRQSKVVPLLTARLRDDDPDVRVAAAVGLAGFDPGARTSLPSIVRLCDDDVPRVRRAAVSVGRELGDIAAAMIPKLFELAARDPDLETRVAALEALGAMRLRVGRYLDDVRRFLDDPHARIRLAAAHAMTGLDRTGHAERIQTVLAEGLKDARASVCAHALRALARFGRPEARLHEAIRAALEHEAYEVRLQALEVLEQAQIVAEFETALDRRLEDPHVLVRARAAMTYAWIEARPVAERLANLLVDESPHVREHAVRALGRLGGPAKFLHARVLALAEDDPDRGVREAVLEVQAGLR